jgi:hypothetical protein
MQISIMQTGWSPICYLNGEVWLQESTSRVRWVSTQCFRSAFSNAHKMHYYISATLWSHVWTLVHNLVSGGSGLVACSSCLDCGGLGGSWLESLRSELGVSNTCCMDSGVSGTTLSGALCSNLSSDCLTFNSRKEPLWISSSSSSSCHTLRLCPGDLQLWFRLSSLSHRLSSAYLCLQLAFCDSCLWLMLSRSSNRIA